MLLKDSLGGNCRTTLLGMLSPSFEFCQESNNTLGFAHSCKSILNVVKPNKYRKTVPASAPVKLKKKDSAQKLPWHSFGFEREDCMIPSKFGDLRVAKIGSDEWQEKVICLHGCPSSLEAFAHQFPLYSFLKY